MQFSTSCISTRYPPFLLGWDFHLKSWMKNLPRFIFLKWKNETNDDSNGKFIRERSLELIFFCFVRNKFAEEFLRMKKKTFRIFLKACLKNIEHIWSSVMSGNKNSFSIEEDPRVIRRQTNDKKQEMTSSYWQPSRKAYVKTSSSNGKGRKKMVFIHFHREIFSAVFLPFFIRVCFCWCWCCYFDFYMFKRRQSWCWCEDEIHEKRVDKEKKFVWKCGINEENEIFLFSIAISESPKTLHHSGVSEIKIKSSWE